MLNQEQIEKLRLMLAGSGWRDVVLPVLRSRANELLKTLCLLKAERQEPYKSIENDDLIRGEIRSLEWVLAAFPNEIAVYDHNRRMDELQGAGGGDTAAAANP